MPGYIFLGQNRDFVSYVYGQDFVLKNTHGVNYWLDTVKLIQSDSSKLFLVPVWGFLQPIDNLQESDIQISRNFKKVWMGLTD